MAHLSANYLEAVRDFDRLLQLQANITPLAPAFRKVVAEIILIRAFSVLENVVSGIALKLVCGAPYCDGTYPSVLVKARSSAEARTKMISHGRPKNRWPVWTKAGEIAENVRYLLSNTDHFIVLVAAHGTLIDEMRRVRNRIAHNNSKSRTDYQVVVRRHYGARLNNVTPGLYLLSLRRPPVTPLEDYLVRCKVFVKNLVKA